MNEPHTWLSMCVGVKYHFDTTVSGLATDAQSGAVTGLRTDKGVFAGDAFVFCTGAHTPQFFASASEARVSGAARALPIAPLKSHSLSLYVPEFDPKPFALSVAPPSEAMVAAAKQDGAAPPPPIWVHAKSKAGAASASTSTSTATASIYNLPALSTAYVARPRTALGIAESRTLVVPYVLRSALYSSALSFAVLWFVLLRAVCMRCGVVRAVRATLWC
jgi:hypothetical protein